MTEKVSHSPEAEAAPPPRTAIVAIHGVGEHEPGATVDEIRRLLMATAPDGYRDFTEQTLSIPVRPPANLRLGAAADRERADGKGFCRILSGFGSVFAKSAQRTRSRDFAGPTATGVDILFMRSLLADASDYRDVYDTKVARGIGSHGGREVDIYELYWSDLSHYGRSLASLASELFQLIVHLASLGRASAAIGLAVVPPELSRPWRWFYRATALSYWLLAMPIVIGNFLLVLLALFLIPVFAATYLGDRHAAYAGVSAAVTGLVGAVTAAFASYSLATAHGSGPPRWPIGRVFLPLAVGAGAALVAWRSFGASAGAELSPAAVLVWAAALAPPVVLAGAATMRAYDKSRPGALGFSIILTGLITIWTIVTFLASPSAAPGEATATLLQFIGHAAEGLYGTLVVSWLGLYLSNAALLAISAWVIIASVRTAKPDDMPRDAIRRTIGTALLSGALPPTLFLAIVLTLWSGFYQTFVSSFPTNATYAPTLTWLLGGQANVCVLFKTLIDKSASGEFLIFVLLMLIAFGLTAWGVAPSILREVAPGDGRDTQTERSFSTWLGSWLDGGFGAIGLAGALVVIAFFILFPWATSRSLSAADASSGVNSFVTATGFLVTGSAVGVFALAKVFAGEISSAFDRARVLIDITLDVDNWLRERPAGQTPRVKIVSRFRSLLRVIAESKQYDRVVIVAHSQGTVIAADTLRYLLATQDPLLKKLPPRHMLTAGSPLRQLYALRLPFLYDWAEGKNPAHVGPDVKACGLVEWVNVYGSGDYVGRYLWSADDDAGRWEPNAWRVQDSHAETCIGPEAHTHYFDETRHIVGRKLRDLI